MESNNAGQVQTAGTFTQASGVLIILLDSLKAVKKAVRRW